MTRFNNQEIDSLYTEVKRLVEKVRNYLIDRRGVTKDEFRAKFNEMASKAAELHNHIKNNGETVKHHKYMIENRGCDPDDLDFYRHLHPVEDLLAFIDDEHANDDPEDQTVGDEFEFKVYSRRWGHYDFYSLIRNELGWYVEFNDKGQSDKGGKPNLYEYLDHDSINYPEELPRYLEWLWIQAEEQGLSHEDVQNALNKLAEWTSLCEKNTPRGIFRGWK